MVFSCHNTKAKTIMNKIMLKLFIFVLFFPFAIIFNNAQADVLIIDRINKSHTFETPSRGLTMNQVIAQFGEPSIKKNAVGEPPITVWKYDKFSVYFEKSWVINSVINKATPEEIGPKLISN